MKQTEFVSKYADKSAFTALLNCAEVGRRNRISPKLPISVPLSISFKHKKTGGQPVFSIICFSTSRGFLQEVLLELDQLELLLF